MEGVQNLVGVGVSGGRVPPGKSSTEFCVAEFDIYRTSKQ